MKLTYKTKDGLKTLSPSFFNEQGNLRENGTTFEFQNALKTIANCPNGYPRIEPWDKFKEDAKWSKFSKLVVFQRCSFNEKIYVVFVDEIDESGENIYLVAADSEESACLEVLVNYFEVERPDSKSWKLPLDQRIFEEIKVYTWESCELFLKDFEIQTNLASIADGPYDGDIAFNCDGVDLIISFDFEESKVVGIKPIGSEDVGDSALA